MKRGVSVRAAARALGMNQSSLTRARQAGRCTFNADGTVDVAKVRRQLARNTDTSKPRNRLTGKPHGNGNGHDLLPTGVAASRALKADYEARLSQLEYEREAKLLVSKEAVERAMSEKVRRTRDQLLAIPDRIDALLAAETDVQRCNHLLNEEIERALTELAGPVTR